MSNYSSGTQCGGQEDRSEEDRSGSETDQISGKGFTSENETREAGFIREDLAARVQPRGFRSCVLLVLVPTECVLEHLRCSTADPLAENHQFTAPLFVQIARL